MASLRLTGGSYQLLLLAVDHLLPGRASMPKLNKVLLAIMDLFSLLLGNPPS